MKKLFAQIKFIFFFVIFAAINVENPAKGLFSDKFGTTVQQIISNIIILFLGLVGLIAMAYIIYGGYQIVTARGNSEAAGAGKKTLTNAIIGLIIVIMSYIIVSVVINAAYGRLSGVPDIPTETGPGTTIPGTPVPLSPPGGS